MNLKEYIHKHPQLKKRLHRFIMHPVKTRPYWWIRLFQPFYMKKGKGAVIYKSVRKDLPPFHLFHIGNFSIIEDYSCLNNAVGDIIIGNYCRIGLNNTVIGPIHIEDGVNISQNVVLIGLNHNYQDINQNIIEQGITTAPIHIGSDTIIGANTVILPGVSIGKHCFIGAGCIVTKNIPDYSVAIGNPARIIKRYNFSTLKWEKIT